MSEEGGRIESLALCQALPTAESYLSAVHRRGFRGREYPAVGRLEQAITGMKRIVPKVIGERETVDSPRGPGASDERMAELLPELREAHAELQEALRGVEQVLRGAFIAPGADIPAGSKRLELENQPLRPGRKWW